ncbi:hypothetical protein TUM20985_58310 [Mycobacterium antarcticum]|uniref:ferredoxin n=1 Tax=Mycolicibacterium sp. TUM20985 TaxID=3023370 RepID=UPI002573105E|nr:ferredoxin [Mycolicibacterium sp. TUM20985]BDX35284.1 hypothetical protein TUM20985_58310 [Mycolicibacterium sp. TUM20985]
MKIELDRDKCIGVSTCVGLAPSVFTMGADGKAQVRVDVTDKSDEAVIAAVDSCPMEAIRLIEG